MGDASVIKAQQLLEKSKLTEAEVILKETIQLFKKKEEYVKALDCQVLLAECNVVTSNENKIEDSINYYEKNVT